MRSVIHADAESGIQRIGIWENPTVRPESSAHANLMTTHVAFASREPSVAEAFGDGARERLRRAVHRQPPSATRPDSRSSTEAPRFRFRRVCPSCTAGHSRGDRPGSSTGRAIVLVWRATESVVQELKDLQGDLKFDGDVARKSVAPSWLRSPELICSKNPKRCRPTSAFPRPSQTCALGHGQRGRLNVDIERVGSRALVGVEHDDVRARIDHEVDVRTTAEVRAEVFGVVNASKRGTGAARREESERSDPRRRLSSVRRDFSSRSRSESGAPPPPSPRRMHTYRESCSAHPRCCRRTHHPRKEQAPVQHTRGAHRPWWVRSVAEGPPRSRNPTRYRTRSARRGSTYRPADFATRCTSAQNRPNTKSGFPDTPKVDSKGREPMLAPSHQRGLGHPADTPYLERTPRTQRCCRSCWSCHRGSWCQRPPDPRSHIDSRSAQRSRRKY